MFLLSIFIGENYSLEIFSLTAFRMQVARWKFYLSQRLECNRLVGCFISHRFSQMNRSLSANGGTTNACWQATDITEFTAIYHRVLHPSLAVTLCDLCMPKAFCGLEMCAKRLSELCALCERKKLPSESQAFFLTWRVCTYSHRKTQMNRTHSIPQRH